MVFWSHFMLGFRNFLVFIEVQSESKIFCALASYIEMYTYQNSVLDINGGNLKFWFPRPPFLKTAFYQMTHE